MKYRIKKALKALGLYNVMCRFLFVIMIPIWVFNIVTVGIIALPYWIFTGKAIYGTKMVQGFNGWWLGLT